jgi:hypothetical protein
VKGVGTLGDPICGVKHSCKKRARATDAKEVGVGNPAEETCCHPNTSKCNEQVTAVNTHLACPPCRLPVLRGSAQVGCRRS